MDPVYRLGLAANEPELLYQHKSLHDCFIKATFSKHLSNFLDFWWLGKLQL